MGVEKEEIRLTRCAIGEAKILLDNRRSKEVY